MTYHVTPEGKAVRDTSNRAALAESLMHHDMTRAEALNLAKHVARLLVQSRTGPLNVSTMPPLPRRKPYRDRDLLEVTL